VDVTAESLYEAVAQAWRILGENEWNADGGRPSVFVVKVKQPEIEHKVRTQDFENWLARHRRARSKWPLKNRVRRLLGRES